MTYAILATGGKQYKVSPGTLLDVEKLEGAEGTEVRLAEVLAIRKEERFEAGQPLVKGALVKAKIVGQVKGPKVINFKYKRRKGYHRKVGHRQPLTRLMVVEILENGAH
ncbi:MAG: 50S ribosomal protein L21 [Candidatus Omnitrophica bacterium]|nr:50S ribosomal protein L21 [Candidatus Omnitrophota bacterium]